MKYSGTYRLEKHLKKGIQCVFWFYNNMWHTYTHSHSPSEKDLACTYFKVVYFFYVNGSIDRYIHKIKSNFKKVNTQYCSNNNNNQLFSFFLFFFWRSDRWRRKENSLSSFRLLSSNNSFSILFSSYSFYTITITVPIELSWW